MVQSTPILGHAHQLGQLQNDLKTGNVSHAYLFEGPRHVGKFTVAKSFAADLLTHGLAGEDRERTLHEIGRLIHPDLLVLDMLWMEDRNEDPDVIARYSNVSQEHRRKAKAKSDTISIDDIRAIQERLHELTGGRYRCCLIRSVERMQAEAVNALLKILEEPPEGLVFLLTTESLTSLLPTLVSRARLLRFSRLPDAALAPALKGMPDEEQRFLLRVCQGAPGMIMRLRADADLLRREHTLASSASAAWHARSLGDCMRALKPLEDKKEADRFLLHLSLALREEQLTLPDTCAPALFTLLRGMETNVSAQLLLQRFAFAVTGAR